MINFVLLALIVFMIRRNKGFLSYSQVFLVLVIAFHYVPLMYMEANYADLPSLYSLGEVRHGINRVATVCLFVYLGALMSQRFFKKSSTGAVSAPPRSLSGWIGINLVMGALIIVNNLFAAAHALSAGYLDIYSSAEGILPIKTITILPVYVFTMFYLFLNWIKFRHIFTRITKRSLLAVFSVIVISFVFTGSRSTVIYLAVSLIVLCSARLGLKIWKYFPHALIMIAASTVIGVLREGVLAQLDVSGMLLRPVIELSNTAIVFLTSDSISNEFVISGSRYLSGLLYLLPVSLLAQFGIVPPVLLSQQYVTIVDPGWSEMGGGFGFSLLAEIYLLGGQMWAWLIALLIGIYLGWIDSNLKSASVAKAALAASMGFLMLFVVRGEILELYRNVFVVVLLYLACVVRFVKK